MNNLQNKKILIVDDDVDIFRIVAHYLSKIGAQAYEATNGELALRQFYTYKPDLVILDRMMPGLDGFQVCSRMLEVSEVPIIFLSALGHEDDIVQGLECGAVDYVTKPFSIKVLLARVQAALRQTTIAPKQESLIAYSDGYLAIDLSQRTILADGQPVKLTPTEYQLLVVLFQNAGRIVTFRQILEEVWGWEYQDNSDYVHVCVSHLRRKLEPDPKNPRYVLTEYGVGYQFVRQRSPAFSEAL